MADNSQLKILSDTADKVTRRRFVRGVIGGGAAVSSAAYLLCAEQVRQLEGESPFDNLMEVKS